MEKAAPPNGLGVTGSALWDRVVDGLVLRPDELATLEDACRITDMITALDEAWAEEGRPMTAKGSMGQLIIHPLIGEIRSQRMSRNALWRQLKLPEVGDEPAGANQHRSAAQSRWSAAHGKGA